MTQGTIDRTEEFFLRLAERPQPMLHRVSGTVRFDIEGIDPPWRLTFDRGRVIVERSHAEADATMSTDPALFERIVTGEANAFTAALRGRLRLGGDVRLLVPFRAVLPGPPRHRTDVPPPVAVPEHVAGMTDRGTERERPA